MTERRTFSYLLRVFAAIAVLAGMVALWSSTGAGRAFGGADPYAAAPDGPCGPGSRPETTQGRVPAADYTSGRAAEGYSCNTEEVAHTGASGGYRTYNYTDTAGH